MGRININIVGKIRAAESDYNSFTWSGSDTTFPRYSRILVENRYLLYSVPPFGVKLVLSKDPQ